MSMDAGKMKDAIITEINKEAESAANANKKFGDAILKYIVDNMEITYGWSATNLSSGASDPQVTFKASLSGSGILVVSSSFEQFLVTLTAFIKSSIAISPATGFTLSPLSFSMTGVIIATKNGLDTQDTAMEKFCSDIITSLKTSFPNPTPASGSHAAFTGATTGMVIA